MLDLVTPCFAPCCSCFQSPVVRKDMSKVSHTEEKLQRLESVMKDLISKKNDTEKKLSDPINRGRQRTHQVQRWLDKVGEKDEQVNNLLDEFAKRSCIQGPCYLNCFSRYRISSDAVRLLKEITPWKDEKLDDLFADQQPPKLVPESYKTVGKEIFSNIAIACSYLADEKVDMIGIWGMGGVGKSKLLKKIKQTLVGDASMGFNHVLLIEASKGIQLEELRKQIAQSLLLESSASKEDILNVLKISNFVLLLDNIWEQVDLIELGIPPPCDDDDDDDDNSTKQYKCKVIFTTRSEAVCAQMRASERIKVKCLERNEAWDLFKYFVNQAVIESDESINKIANQLMNMCCGLPLALQVIGKAMSNVKTLAQWEFVLRSLENSNTKVVEGMEESLFPILKFSYDNLPNHVQKFFLAASILQGRRKYKLLECLMGLGLIGDFSNLQDAYANAEEIIKTLEESSLLYLSRDGYMCFHDVIYEMAMWIASDCGTNRNKWIVKKYNGLEAELPTDNAGNYRFTNKVIIEGNFLLPVLSHRCSDLSCLMILHNCSLPKIPEGFFLQMPNLTFLDLSHTAIRDLPKDIKCLVNLRHLNISSTGISSLPKQLAYLNKLQYLICRNLEELGKIRHGLLSRLQNLKVIDIFPTGWLGPKGLKKLKKHNSIKAIGMCVVSQEILQQLPCLPTTRLGLYKLDTLTSLSFDTLSCKNQGFLKYVTIESCPQLEKIEMKGSSVHLKTLQIYDVKELKNIIWTDVSPPDFFPILKKLLIYKCNLVDFSWVLHLPCLSDLSIEDCPEVETLFSVKQIAIQPVLKGSAFPVLQQLHLVNLPKLASISNVALDFPQLSTPFVRLCPKLNILPLAFSRGIDNN